MQVLYKQVRLLVMGVFGLLKTIVWLRSVEVGYGWESSHGPNRATG